MIKMEYNTVSNYKNGFGGSTPLKNLSWPFSFGHISNSDFWFGLLKLGRALIADGSRATHSKRQEPLEDTSDCSLQYPK